MHALPSALAEIWSARADIALFVLTGDQPVAAKLRRRFGLAPPDDIACAVPPTLFGTSLSTNDMPACTVVVPVFNAYDDTQYLLARLPETLSPDTHVILIDDGSDDTRISPLLLRFADAHENSRIIRHDANLGFVAAANSGIASAQSNHHIILLNTDTLPPKGWVDRLIAPIAHDKTIASVTPVSNNAEILSIPHPGIETSPTPIMVESVDRIANALSHRHITVPTGVGFCMALNRAFIDRIGAFDPAFGRGYGEEVDWCRRAISAGGCHVVQTNLFVGHRGGASFGVQEKARRIRTASRTIVQRYPTFNAEVQKWVNAAPMAPEQLAISLAWLNSSSDKPVTVFLGHSLGGGAETALQSEIADTLETTPGVVVLRVGGPRLWRIELRGKGFKLAGDVASDDLLRQLFKALPRRRMVYSCGVGATDPTIVPRTLLQLQTDGIELRLHDFLPISPSWNLLDSHGNFDGVPPEDTTDPAHHVLGTRRQSLTSHQEWRRLWRTVIDKADRIVTFAPSGRDLLTTAYPNASDKITVVPHSLPSLPNSLPLSGQSIGVLGGINRAKGGAVLQELSGQTGRRLVIIGELDGQFRLPNPHVVYGRYEQSQIETLAKHYGIGLWLIPSICPETFSFATHEALATGLPVVSFNIGAQADALHGAANGHVLDIDPSNTAALSSSIEEIWSAAHQRPSP